MLNDTQDQLKNETGQCVTRSLGAKTKELKTAAGNKRRRAISRTRKQQVTRDDDVEEDQMSCISRSSSGCSSRNSVEDPNHMMMVGGPSGSGGDNIIASTGREDNEDVDADDDDKLSDSCGSNSSSAGDQNQAIYHETDDDEAIISSAVEGLVSEHNLVGSDKSRKLVADRTARWRKGERNKVKRQVENQVKAAGQNKGEFKAELVWTNIILFVILHSSLPIGIYMLYTQFPWKTLLFSFLGIYASGLGVTGGSHRLWSHRSYKAKWPVQVILVILQTMAGQNSIYTWSRDHRVHHKFAETNADPHNIKRGFFFAHMGWLCCKKHPDVKEKGKLIDMSDLEANPFVMFQHRHFWWMSAAFTVLVPTMIPVLLWGERFWTSFVFSFMIRYLITLHGTWLVNSAAHYYGHRPYDTKIEARESPYVIYNALGEGFHNYHHTFPYDYATSEFGKYLNITTAFIDFCAALGLVDGRRKVDEATIMKRRLRTGDLSEEARTGNMSAVSKSIDEETGDEEQMATTITSATTATAVRPRRLPASLNNIIHELPYISGLTSMKYTM